MRFIVAGLLVVMSVTAGIAQTLDECVEIYGLCNGTAGC